MVALVSSHSEMGTGPRIVRKQSQCRQGCQANYHWRIFIKGVG